MAMGSVVMPSMKLAAVTVTVWCSCQAAPVTYSPAQPYRAVSADHTAHDDLRFDQAPVASQGQLLLTVDHVVRISADALIWVGEVDAVVSFRLHASDACLLAACRPHPHANRGRLGVHSPRCLVWHRRR